jgi:hypothetical protein
MAITGHKTRSIFDRYNIVDEADLADAIARLQTYVHSQPRRPKGGITEAGSGGLNARTRQVHAQCVPLLEQVALSSHGSC